MKDFLSSVGFGLAVLLICIGFGSCVALSSGNIKIDIKYPARVEAKP